MKLLRLLSPAAAVSVIVACSDAPSAPASPAVAPGVTLLSDPPPPPIDGKLSGSFSLSTDFTGDGAAKPGTFRIQNDLPTPTTTAPTSITFSVSSRYLNNRPNTLSWIKTESDVSDIPAQMRKALGIGNGKGEVRQTVETFKGQGALVQFDQGGNLWTINLEQFTGLREGEKQPLFTRLDDCLEVKGQTCAQLNQAVVAIVYPFKGLNDKGQPIFGDGIVSQFGRLTYIEDVVQVPDPEPIP